MNAYDDVGFSPPYCATCGNLSYHYRGGAWHCSWCDPAPGQRRSCGIFGTEQTAQAWPKGWAPPQPGGIALRILEARQRPQRGGDGQTTRVERQSPPVRPTARPVADSGRRPPYLLRDLGRETVAILLELKGLGATLRANRTEVRLVEGEQRVGDALLERMKANRTPLHRYAWRRTLVEAANASHRERATTPAPTRQEEPRRGRAPITETTGAQAPQGANR